MHEFEWAIEDIVKAHPDLYLEHCAVMAVSLMHQHSAAPCELTVRCSGFQPAGASAGEEFGIRVS
jgi:hypothetical protein